ncbi:MAG: 6-phosphogluconolactonase [Myxococcota bacterium]
MTPDVTITEAIGPDAGRAVLEAIRGVLSRQRRARLAVPGGSSPVPVFHWLAENLPSDLAARLVVTFVDERHRPAPRTGDWSTWDADHNERLVHEHWIARAATPPEVMSFHVEADLQEALQVVTSRFSDLGAIDIALLGAGPDGHIASLFPDHPGLDEPGPVFAVSDSPKPPPERLSLSMPVIAAASTVIFVSSGENRAPMLARAYRGDPTLPLGRLQPAGAYRWFVDAAAARNLSLEQS